MKAGTLQRARNTPQTMIGDMVIGEMAGLTSLMGASAPPSQAPAANPQKIPKACRLRRRFEWTTSRMGCWSLASGAPLAFNEVYPVRQVRRAGRRVESRNGRQLQLHETG